MTQQIQTLQSKYNRLWNRCYQGCPLFQSWKHEIGNQQNLIILINGDTRSGKSIIALDIAEAMDYKFQDPETVKLRFVYSSKEFLKLINDPSLGEGSVIVWEEVGVGLKSKRWYEDINQTITDVLQVFGHKSFILILTTPQKRFLDKDARVMCNVYIETNRGWLDMRRKFNYALVQKITNSSKYDKSYFANYISDGIKISRWKFCLPRTKGLLDVYEGHSRSRKNVIEKLSEQRAIFHEKKEKTAYLTPEYIVQEVMANKKEYLKKWGKRIVPNVDNITTHFQIGETSALYLRTKRMINSILRKEQPKKFRKESVRSKPQPQPVEEVAVVEEKAPPDERTTEEIIGSFVEGRDNV